jgi:hypothetical protein
MLSESSIALTGSSSFCAQAGEAKTASKMKKNIRTADPPVCVTPRYIHLTVFGKLVSSHFGTNAVICPSRSCVTTSKTLPILG